MTMMALAFVSAQETRCNYKDAQFTIENKEAQLRLSLKSHYYLEGGAFMPVSDFGALYHEGKPVRMNGDLNFQKLRTSVYGRFDENWGFKFEFDYAKARIKYLDMELDYRFRETDFIRFGSMKVPGSMSVNHSTSANMQLGTPMGLSLGSDRRMGIAYFHTAPRLYYAVGFYTYDINTLFQARLYGIPEMAIAARVGYNIVNQKDEKLFLALNAYVCRPQDGIHPIDLEGSVESGLLGHVFVRNIIPDGRGMLNIGAEAAYQKGRFLAYAELLGTAVATDRAAHAPFFIGWSGTVSYVLSGQSRGYRPSTGDFTGSPLVSGRNAVEVGARISGLSLNSGEFVGGSGVSYSLFGSYFINRHLNFMAQVSYLDHSAEALGNGTYTPIISPFRGADFMSFQLRTSIIF